MSVCMYSLVLPLRSVWRAICSIRRVAVCWYANDRHTQTHLHTHIYIYIYIHTYTHIHTHSFPRTVFSSFHPILWDIIMGCVVFAICDFEVQPFIPLRFLLCSAMVPISLKVYTLYARCCYCYASCARKKCFVCGCFLCVPSWCSSVCLLSVCLSFCCLSVCLFFCQLTNECNDGFRQVRIRHVCGLGRTALRHTNTGTHRQMYLKHLLFVCVSVCLSVYWLFGVQFVFFESPVIALECIYFSHLLCFYVCVCMCVIVCL